VPAHPRAPALAADEADEAGAPSALAPPTCPVTCEATGDVVAVAPGQPLLDAALDQGVELDHGCRVGVCGACAVTIVEGAEHADEPDPIETDSLERFDLVGRCRLACRLTCRGPLRVRPADD